MRYPFVVHQPPHTPTRHVNQGSYFDRRHQYGIGAGTTPGCHVVIHAIDEKTSFAVGISNFTLLLIALNSQLALLVLSENSMNRENCLEPTAEVGTVNAKKTGFYASRGNRTYIGVEFSSSALFCFSFGRQGSMARPQA
jgi:hypothetical protein